jgi:hypothetical protein
LAGFGEARGVARPSRILVTGGSYHVGRRRNRREAIYWMDADRRQFLGLAAELPERFGIEVQGVLRRCAAGLAQDTAKMRSVEGMKRRLRERRR